MPHPLNTQIRVGVERVWHPSHSQFTVHANKVNVEELIMPRCACAAKHTVSPSSFYSAHAKGSVAFRMRTIKKRRGRAWGRGYTLCVCVCLFRAYYCFFSWTLDKGKCFYGYYTVFSKFEICRFAKQSLVLEIWQYLLTPRLCDRLRLLHIKICSY